MFRRITSRCLLLFHMKRWLPERKASIMLNTKNIKLGRFFAIFDNHSLNKDEAKQVADGTALKRDEFFRDEQPVPIEGIKSCSAEKSFKKIFKGKIDKAQHFEK